MVLRESKKPYPRIIFIYRYFSLNSVYTINTLESCTYSLGPALCLQSSYRATCCSRPGPEVIEKISCSTQLSMEFFLLINVQKMPTFVGILTCLSGKNSTLYISGPINSEFLDIFILMSI